MNLLSFLRWPIGITVIAVIAAGILGGPETALIVALLSILEISISFDNAVVNAAVLHRMSEKWQRIFLTWGILIAVFGMRLVFPIVLVALAAGLSLPEVLDQAFNEQELYASNLEDAYPVIASFGGMFLLLVFLNFFLDEEKDVNWLGGLERVLGRLGRVDSISTGIAILVLVLTTLYVPEESQIDVLVWGIVGIVVYLFVSNLADLLEPDDDEDEAEAEPPAVVTPPGTETPTRGETAAAAAGLAGKAGFASFLYLEVLDASFSFDGVIGAFAISKDIIVIAAGLGLGALYIRTLTVYLVRAGTLKQYRYLEHGAHWAIGALAVILVLGIEYHVPELITGLLGASIILISLFASIAYNRREEAAGHEVEMIDPTHPHHH